MSVPRVAIDVRIVQSLATAPLIALYEDAGWWEPGQGDNEALASKIVEGSFAFAAAFSGERLVGMARCISDGVSDAYIQDVTVHHDFRRQGIASLLVRALLDHLHQHRIGWIGLIAQPGSESLYQQLGFTRMIDHVPMHHDAPR